MRMNEKNVMQLLSFIVFLIVLLIPVLSNGADMIDYCQNPPFVQKTIKPNLLMIIDNSASMYDLAHIDTTSANPTYCYDATYDDTNEYAGYFDKDKFYSFDSIDKQFEEAIGFPAGCDSNTTVTDVFCVDIDTSTSPSTVSQFFARGNFLNWLATSKFDVEKQILTGGKYDPVDQILVAESRGCVGRRFIKEYNGNCNSGAPCEVTFAVEGEPNPDPTRPSEGGQTYIEIFDGNYDETNCNDAIEAIESGNLGTIKTQIKACLDYPGGNSLEAKQGVLFNQSVQACWALDKNGTPLGQDEVNTVKNQCPDIYAFTGGPAGIPLGDPATLCNSNYAGACYDPAIPDDIGPPLNVWPFNGQVTGQKGSDCILQQHAKFCNDYDTPPVIDPTDAVSESGETYNVPALLSDTGILAQLDLPIGTFPAKVLATIEPKGLIQDYQRVIRFGAMSFNIDGSRSENKDVLGGSNIDHRKHCSVNTTEVCTYDEDCPDFSTGETCSLDDLKEASEIIHYIGDPVGDHSSDLIKAIDDIRAETWTPFAEAMYNAIAYYVNNASEFAVTAPPVDPATAIDITFDPVKPNPIQFQCQTNNILIISDGASTADLNSDMVLVATDLTYQDPDTDGTADLADCGDFKGSSYLDDLSYTAQHFNIFDGTTTIDYLGQKITTFTVYSGREVEICGDGTDNDLDGTTDEADCFQDDECHPENLMEETAINGGTKFRKADNPQDLYNGLEDTFASIAAKAGSGTAASVLASGEGSGANLIQALFYPKLERTTKFCSVTTTTLCDTDAECPVGERCINEVSWAGSLQNFWYYVDPYFDFSNIREDTKADRILDLSDDYVTMFFYDPIAEISKAERSQDTDGDGAPDVAQPTVNFDELSSLWEAGKILWERDITVASKKRKIYTTLDEQNLLAGNFSADALNGDSDNSLQLLYYLNLPSGDGDGDGFDDGDYNKDSFIDNLDSQILIDYVHGNDYPTLRSRMTAIDLNGDGDTSDAGEEPKTWKLGDIINSTPQVVSWLPLNRYHVPEPYYFNDGTYGPQRIDKIIPPLDDPVDDSHYITTAAYKSRGMVFTGANDGMLHAFKLGTLDLKWDAGDPDDADGQQFDEKAMMRNPDTTTPLGHEVWSFIPKNALPYLKYLADPDYCHVFSVDLTPYVYDVSIGRPATCGAANYYDCDKVQNAAESSWRTVLIGGMRFGGACRETTVVCDSTNTIDLNGDGLVNDDDCVKTPVQVNESGVNVDVGFSSYFALDITDPENPELMWEFSNNDIGNAELATGGLGFATTGPAVVRISAKDGSGNPLPDKNGRWFVVFGSGPTGPIDTVEHQFLGRSEQMLKFFVIDLAEGPSSNVWVVKPSTAIKNAFAGSIANAVFDNEISAQDYQDDAIYAGFVKLCTATRSTPPMCTAGTWTDGGMGRIVTYADLDPANWKWRTVMDNIGPVTSTISHLRNKEDGIDWLFFGSGRYYYGTTDVIDDGTNQRTLFGIKDPCFCQISDVTCNLSLFDTESTVGLDPDCTSLRAFGDLTDVTNVGSVPTVAAANDPAFKGWYINLDDDGTFTYGEGDPIALVTRDYWSERVITDPLARVNGTVFFTTYKPYNDACIIGGKTFIWGLKAETGGPLPPTDGKAIVQVSTGSIEQVDLSKAFQQDGLTNTDSRGDRRTGAIEGVPPTAQGLSLLSSPPPVRRIIQIKER